MTTGQLGSNLSTAGRTHGVGAGDRLALGGEGGLGIILLSLLLLLLFLLLLLLL